ncbi:Major facilitator superfamily domain general substrate transporter [Penicillium sp. IBT 16267x]|nr:Major facilitator superfamily domain general substrate transporter [Penicillium sp. IBT 16267x]
MARYLQKPPNYVLACISCSANGLLFGMDTGIIGPVTDMKDFKAVVGGSQSSTIHGLIVSSILIPAALPSLFAGHLADRLGRAMGISIGCFIFGVGAALEASAVGLGMFIAGRVIEGLGEGLFLGNLVVYICEVSPTKHRGPLTTGPQLVITAGICVGYFICYGTSKHIESSFSWRTPFILLASLAMVLSAASLLLLPPSPPWLAMKGRHAEANAVWEKLGVDYSEHEKVDLQEIQGDAFSKRGTMEKLLDIFSKDVRSRTLRRLHDGCTAAERNRRRAIPELTSSDASFFASGISALVIFVATIPGTLYADKWGRKSSIISGNAVHTSTGAGRWVVIIFIYVFAVIYSMTWGVSVKIFAAEVNPQRCRAATATLAHSSNWLANFVVALVTPILLSKSSYGAYFLFGGCAIVTAVIAALFMHETKGKSLEEIEATFKRQSSAQRLTASDDISTVFHQPKSSV